MPERMVGTVVGVNERGFFFISGPDDRDYFALVSDLPDHRSLTTLIPSETQIEFTPVLREKGPAAINLRVLTEEEVHDHLFNRSGNR